MNYIVTKYPQGTFSWTDITSTDIKKTKDFLTGLFGWTSEDMPTQEGKPPYTMFYLDGKVVAGGGPAYVPNMPSFWTSYISIDNADNMAAKAEKLGAKIIMPAMDVLDSGRMVGLQDPTGATFFLWQPKNHIGAQVINTAGAMCWNDLYTKDLSTAKQFYTDLFGWTYEEDKVTQGYVTIKNNGRGNGGMMKITEEMAGMPPCWMPYFTVKNLSESLKKTTELGGKIYQKSKDISVGKIATVAEPTGAGFLLIEMSVTPAEWQD